MFIECYWMFKNRKFLNNKRSRRENDNKTPARCAVLYATTFDLNTCSVIVRGSGYSEYDPLGRSPRLGLDRGTIVS